MGEPYREPWGGFNRSGPFSVGKKGQELETGQTEEGPDRAPGHRRCRGKETETEGANALRELDRLVRPIEASSPSLPGDRSVSRHQRAVLSYPYHVDHHDGNSRATVQ